MLAETREELKLEIAHVLFIDIVGYSKLLTNEQRERSEELNRLVRETGQFRAAEAEGKLVRLPTGDGMVLAFFTSPDAPVRCAVAIDRALAGRTDLPLRMGIHSGPVELVEDVNDKRNVAGSGVNTAQRVMDCGDAGHILLSARAADDLAQYAEWKTQLHYLGEVEVKHGVRVRVANLHTPEMGNAQLPRKLQRQRLVRRRRLLIASITAALVVITVSLGVWAWQQHLKSVQQAAVKSIAILPFKPLVAATSDPVLEMGMADTLITKLSGSSGIIVPSLMSVQAFAGSDPVAAGRKLGVSSVLEGTLQRAANRLRVTVRLINVADGSSPWSGTYDEKFTDVFTVQDTISQKVAEALALRLNPEEQKRLTKRYTENLDAYQLYLTGRFHWSKLAPPEIIKSIGLFEQAIALDPNYALAYFGLGDAYRTLAMTGDLRPKDNFPQASAAARKAIELDPSLAEPHVTLSFVKSWFDWDRAGAEREARCALELNPNLAFAYLVLAGSLGADRVDEAVAAIKRARQLDPVSPPISAIGGSVLLAAGRPAEALEYLQHALDLNPQFFLAHLFLGDFYLQQQKYAEALAELDTAVDASHGNSEAVCTRAYVWAITGDQAKAQATLDELTQQATQRYVPPWDIALVHHALGHTDEAFAWLEKGIEERDPHMTFLPWDKKWDALRSDPRFVAVLQRVDLSKQ